MTRHLEKSFFTALNKGLLAPILNMVKSDQTLDMEIRNNYINIYYRGGNLSKLEEINPKTSYSLEFNENYFTGNPIKLPSKLNNTNGVDDLLECIPLLKHKMDLYFGRQKKTKKDKIRSWDEREAQQLLIRENNFGRLAMSTDYYICDMEYDNHKGSKFDLVAVKWPSRFYGKNCKLAVIEMKYGDNALKGDSGLLNHLKDINDFFRDEINRKSLEDEMQEVLKQKVELGLITNKNANNTIKSWDENDKPDLIFILSNHHPKKSNLLKEIKRICPTKYDSIKIKFAIASFMGYCLFEENIVDLETFRDKLGDYQKVPQ